MVRFNVAVNRNYLNQRGEREADFINIVAWRNLAENCANYLQKGSLVGIDGRLQTGKYVEPGRSGRSIQPMCVAEDVRFLEPHNRNAESGGAFGALTTVGTETVTARTRRWMTPLPMTDNRLISLTG